MSNKKPGYKTNLLQKFNFTCTKRYISITFLFLYDRTLRQVYKGCGQNTFLA
ncbi:hypothetical protein H312_02774 [Anncaliia algerae PRA339]|uniref:Uncharacterized protein n=1 Tax=Anncaliia algerae PRA339 TaxID=1288291 RepID=A0A059EY91_9MICR|nr:hypothetical protein H312_02774 [Anncaliia algerae PRA339]